MAGITPSGVSFIRFSNRWPARVFSVSVDTRAGSSVAGLSAMAMRSVRPGAVSPAPQAVSASTRARPSASSRITRLMGNLLCFGNHYASPVYPKNLIL